METSGDPPVPDMSTAGSDAASSSPQSTGTFNVSATLPMPSGMVRFSTVCKPTAATPTPDAAPSPALGTALAAPADPELSGADEPGVGAPDPAVAPPWCAVPLALPVPLPLTVPRH